MDAQQKWNGRTAEFALTQKGICIDKQLNLLGQLTSTFWAKQFIYLFIFSSFCDAEA